jgi:predicted permease
VAFPGIRRLFRLVVRPPPVEREVEAELEFHLDLEAARLEGLGMRPDAARLEARRRFGDLRLTREVLVTIDKHRRGRERRAGWLDDLRQDLGYALRGFRRQPGFAALAIVTLGLGVGANATMFAIVDRLLIRPPAFLADPDRTGRVYLRNPTAGGGEQIDNQIFYRTYLDLTGATRALEGAAAFFDDQRLVGAGEAAKYAGVSLVSASFWGLFNARPALGRFFGPGEDVAPHGSAVVVLAYGFWRSEFGGDRGVLGRKLIIGAHPYTVIGVAPRGFSGMSLRPVAAFIPITAGAAESFGDNYASGYNVSWLEMLGRRRPGISPSGADAELTRVYRVTRRVDPRVDVDQIAHSRAELAPALLDRGPLKSDSSRVALWLTAVAAALLLIVAANVGSLLLVRSLRRRREVAVRIALGAGRRRLLRQLLTESSVLALVGGAAGFAIARFGGGLLQRTFLPDVDWSAAPVFDRRALLFTGVTALVTGVLAGLAPVFQVGRTDVTGSLKEGAREGSRQSARLRSSLIVLQVALCVMLLVGAGLFVHSLRNVRALDLGYEPERLIAVDVDFRAGRPQDAERIELQRRILERARAVSGVASAAVSLAIPFGSSYGYALSIPGRDSLSDLGAFYYNAVAGDYFQTTGTRLVRGLGITEADQTSGHRIVVVSETMAHRVWPDREAIGQCLKIGADTTCSEVVGIVRDVRWGSLGDRDRMQLYVPFTDRPGEGTVLVRTEGDPERLAEPVRRELQALMPSGAFVMARPLAQDLDRVFRPWRLGATMFTVFGVLALLVAAIGLYGVVAYGVAQRTHEMGVRMALGARAGDVLRLVVGQGVRVALVGIALGGAGALAAGRLIASLLFGVPAHDPWTFGTVVAILLGVAAVASLVPAWRAARVDPNIALRAE